MRSFMNYFELWLSGLGLVVIAVVPLLMPDDAATRWMAIAITAISVGVIHGVIFWVVRRRQRRIRAATIRTVQGMLKDQINNRLMVAIGELSLHTSADTMSQLRDMQRALQDVTQILNSVSADTMQAWQTRYNVTGDEHAMPSAHQHS